MSVLGTVGGSVRVCVRLCFAYHACVLSRCVCRKKILLVLYVRAWVCFRLRLCARECVHSVCMCVHVCACVCMCVCVCECVCTCVCVRVRVCVCAGTDPKSKYQLFQCMKSPSTTLFVCGCVCVLCCVFV